MLTSSKPAMLATAAVCAIAALGPGGTAQATTTLRTDPGGSLLTSPTTITSTSSNSTTLTFPGVGTSHCNQATFDVDATANTGASSITGTLSSLTFTACSDNFIILNFSSCRLNPGTFPVVHILSNASGGTLTIDDPVIRCSIVGSTTSFCYYTASSAVGTMVNATSSLVFPTTSITATSGSGSLGAACGSSGSASWSNTHIVQGSTNKTVTIRTS